MITALAITGASFALLPALLFLRNLRLYVPAPEPLPTRPQCSVLIPARNEEAGISRCVRSVLGNHDVDLEVIVLDDGSTDRTAAIVAELAAADPRVRLVSATPLPDGWSGKEHACYSLSQHARHPLLVFLDADVWLEPHAFARMAAFMAQSGAALTSGVPRQETRTFSEWLLIPLIHFVMLGFLPLDRMRRTRDPGCSAGCGQLFIARREAYEACGGHSAIRGDLHDGTKLPRAFRAAGFATDLFDATDVAACRMYFSNSAVWSGLGRCAHEAMGAPRVIGPATLLLVVGQVIPFALLIAIGCGMKVSGLALAATGLGVLAAWLPRFIAVARFRQPLSGAILHPLGILALLSIQWFACIRSLRGRPAEWKGRLYVTPRSV